MDISPIAPLRYKKFSEVTEIERKFKRPSISEELLAKEISEILRQLLWGTLLEKSWRLRNVKVEFNLSRIMIIVTLETLLKIELWCTTPGEQPAVRWFISYAPSKTETGWNFSEIKNLNPFIEIKALITKSKKRKMLKSLSLQMIWKSLTRRSRRPICKTYQTYLLSTIPITLKSTQTPSLSPRWTRTNTKTRQKMLSREEWIMTQESPLTHRRSAPFKSQITEEATLETSSRRALWTKAWTKEDQDHPWNK